MAARGWRVIVLDAPHVAHQIREEFQQPCEELRALPRWLGKVRAWHLQRAARRLGVGVVHLNFLYTKQRVWADDLAGPPYIATAWGSDLNREVFQRPPAHEAAIDLILQRASAVTADAWPLLRKAIVRMGGNLSPRDWILWSADLQQFDRTQALQWAAQFRDQLGIAADRRVLLSPRQPQPHYHIDRIVEGFAASRWAHEGVLVIKLHGKGGEDGYLQGVLRRAAELGVADRVLCAPRVPYAQLPGLYAMADAAVSMPEADGVPSTFLELMALQVPIVASDLPGYEGVIAHGDRGLLVPPRDTAALTRALDSLLDDPQQTAAMVERARAWVYAEADWSHSVTRWEELYLHAMSASRPR